MTGSQGRGADGRLVFVAAQEFAQAVGGGDDGGAVGAAGLAAQTFDGSRDRYGGDDTSGRAADRCGHGGDAGFTFPHRLRPAAPTDF